jgi:hypothetical protein
MHCVMGELQYVLRGALIVHCLSRHWALCWAMHSGAMGRFFELAIDNVRPHNFG